MMGGLVEKVLRSTAMLNTYQMTEACLQDILTSPDIMGEGEDQPAPTHRLDVLGFYCPVPVAKTRTVLEDLEDGAILEVLADDPETLHDMPLLLGRTQHRLIDIIQEAGEIRYIIQVRS